jgi:hypothetical protein
MEPLELRRLSSVCPRPIPWDSEVFTLRFSVPESESDIGGTRARGKDAEAVGPGAGRTERPEAVLTAVGQGSQSGCKNPAAQRLLEGTQHSNKLTTQRLRGAK